MEKKMVIDVFNSNGITAVESFALKNGKEIECIRLGDGKVSPTIYKETWESFEDADRALEFAHNVLSNIPEFDTEAFFNKEYFMEHAISCVRHQTADELTVKYPVYGDLEEYIRVMVDMDNMDGYSSIVLTKDHLKALDIDPFEIRIVAREHLKEQATIRSMNEIMMEMMGIEAEDMPIPDDLMYVASTKSKTHGAAVMLLDDLLRRFCIEHGIKSAIIVPSSIHECLILCEESEDSMINDMIQEVNDTQVAENERLSNHCYHFSL